MFDDLDALIEESVVFGELAAGTPASWLSTQADARMVAVLSATTDFSSRKAAEWTPAEKRFLTDNVRWMTDDELARSLGRTPEAVHIQRERELKLPPRRQDPEWPTAREVARLLGIGCSKTVVRWVEAGWVVGRKLALDACMWGVSRQSLTRFVVNPENWIYFQPQRVRDPYLRRLLQLRQARWQDAWWTPGQAAAYHGVSPNAINQCIRGGRLSAKRWGNWWIKRSDAVALRISPGKGHNEQIVWTDAGDAFLLLARALGLSLATIAPLMHWPQSRVWYRLGLLEEQERIAPLLASSGMAVQYNAATGILFADWRNYRARFPRLTNAITRFVHGQAAKADLPYVAYTLTAWAQWHAQDAAQAHTAYCIRQGMLSASMLARYHAELQSWGIEPLLEAL